MADSTNKTYFDYLRDCGCTGTSDINDVLPCSDQAEDVNFNNIGTNYSSTNVRNALVEVDNKRVDNGSDILARVKKEGDNFYGDLVAEFPETVEVGRVKPTADGVTLEGTSIVTLDAPNAKITGHASLVGYTLTVGEGGLIVPVLKATPLLSWNDTDSTGTALLNQAYTDLGVTATTTEIVDKWSYKAVITGTASAALNLTFQLKIDGVAIATTQAQPVLIGQNGISVEFTEVSTYASGSVFTLEAQIDEATGTYTVDYIDFTVSKFTSATSATWGAITGTLSSQADLQSALDAKSSTSHVHASNIITYDNTISGLASTNVKTAIDELAVQPTIVLSGASTATTQEPTAVDTELQVEFGPAQTFTDVSLAVDGTITFNTAGKYEVDFTAHYGRLGSTGVSLLLYRMLLDDVQYGVTMQSKVDNANVLMPYAQSFDIEVTAGQTLKMQIMRDSTGDNSGGLFAVSPTKVGWADAPTASVQVTKK